MDKNFEKFKRKIWLDILIKCLCFALAAAMIAVNAVLLPCKLCGVQLLWVYYVRIGLGAFAICGGIAFLVLRTNDRKIARRIDNELHLEGRVETAYVFEGQEGEMLALQSENANKVLGGFSLLSLAFQSTIAIILACSIATAGIAGIPVVATVVTPLYG